MKSFEVQFRRGTVWTTDSTYDDRELAEQRARQYESSGRRDGVRVVEEVFVEKTKKYMSRTIYRDTKVRQIVQAKVNESRSSKRKEPEKRKELETTSGHRRTPPANSSKPLTVVQLFGILTLLIGVGIGALIGLEYVARGLPTLHVHPREWPKALLRRAPSSVDGREEDHAEFAGHSRELSSRPVHPKL